MSKNLRVIFREAFTQDTFGSVVSMAAAPPADLPNSIEELRALVLLQQGQLCAIYINCPDPWPKKRHHKRRIIQAPFVELVAEKMKAGGILHIATDWEQYSEHMLNVMHNSRDFENLAPDGRACPKPEWRPATKYEKRGERLGHSVFDLVFRRTA